MKSENLVIAGQPVPSVPGVVVWIGDPYQAGTMVYQTPRETFRMVFLDDGAVVEVRRCCLVRHTHGVISAPYGEDARTELALIGTDIVSSNREGLFPVGAKHHPGAYGVELWDSQLRFGA